MSRPTRRTVLAAAGGTCAAALTGCAANGSGRVASVAATGTPTDPATPTVPDPSSREPSSTTTAATPTPAPTVVAAVADIPVGGGTVFRERDLVVTQPAAGRFAAFSATCTHQGCAVNAVAEGVIVCPCHGATFAVADGAPVDGPATRPLPTRAIRVEDGSIVLT